MITSPTLYQVTDALEVVENRGGFHWRGRRGVRSWPLHRVQAEIREEARRRIREGLTIVRAVVDASARDDDRPDLVKLDAGIQSQRQGAALHALAERIHDRTPSGP